MTLKFNNSPRQLLRFSWHLCLQAPQNISDQLNLRIHLNITHVAHLHWTSTMSKSPLAWIGNAASTDSDGTAHDYSSYFLLTKNL
jgi:hypothetical protein